MVRKKFTYCYTYMYVNVNDDYFCYRYLYDCNCGNKHGRVERIERRSDDEKEALQGVKIYNIYVHHSTTDKRFGFGLFACNVADNEFFYFVLLLYTVCRYLYGIVFRCTVHCTCVHIHYFI